MFFTDTPVSEADIFIASRDTDNKRVCGTCGQLKPLCDFYRDGKDSKGNIKYRRDCKDCYKRTRLIESKMKDSNKKG